MVEPVSVTVGSLAALALSKATEAIASGLAGEITKDAYKSLKEKLSQTASSEIAALERTPESPARRAVIEEIIESKPKPEKEALQVLIENLAVALKNENIIKSVAQPQLVTAELVDIRSRGRCSFTVIISINNEHHRLESVDRLARAVIELDGKIIKTIYSGGNKFIDFRIGVHKHKFELRGAWSNWNGSIQSLELSADNKVILRY